MPPVQRNLLIITLFIYQLGEAPQFIKPLTPQVVKEGGILVLECQVKGDPLPKVTWYHLGKEIQNKSRFFKLMELPQTGLSQLTIFEIFKDDEGEIKCVAENKFGALESTTQVQVIGKCPEN